MDDVGLRLDGKLDSPKGVWDRRFLEYFERFNASRFFEAHEVLESLWLTLRRQPDGPFCQGLIQLAGAFVHLQKGRSEPARRLLLRARFHLEPYRPRHWGVELGPVLRLIDGLARELASSPTDQPLRTEAPQVGPNDSPG